jgi:hypothetical protein
MAEKNLPIKFFQKRQKDEMDTEGGGGKPPKWVKTGEALRKLSRSYRNYLSTNVGKLVIEKNEGNNFIPTVFRIKLNSYSTAKSYRSDLAKIFNVQGKINLIGVIGFDEVLVKVDNIDQLNEILKNLAKVEDEDFKNDSIAKGISSIEEMNSFSPAIELSEEDGLVLKVILIDYHDYDLNQIVRKSFEEFCAEKNFAIESGKYSISDNIYRVEIATTDELGVLDDFDGLLAITTMPEYEIVLDEMPEDLAIPVKQPIEGRTYPIVGVLDTGVEPIQHINPWLVDMGFTPSFTDDVIDKRHGTFVTGVLLCGDQLEGHNYTGTDGCHIFEAIVYPNRDKQKITEDELVYEIRQVIEKYSKDVKVWNLSLGTNTEASLTEFSTFGQELDKMQEDFDVIIIKSVGNCENYKIGKPRSRIAKSADSVRSLVVGSLAHDKAQYDLDLKNHPSPFTRVGPGPANIYKPDLVHYGGNAGLYAGRSIHNGVKSFGVNGVITKAIGTSFATPRISALVAGLYQTLNESFNPLLLKALLIHSAKYPEEMKMDIADKLRLAGFGMPANIDDILYNSANEITLILQDSIERGNYINIMDFPYPQSMVDENGFFYGEISITLATNPILEPKQQGMEYCQSNVELKFGTYDEKIERDLTVQTIKNPIGLKGAMNLLKPELYNSKIFAQEDNDFHKERFLIAYRQKYHPIKKWVINLEEFKNINKEKYLKAPKYFYLKLQSYFRDHTLTMYDRDDKEASQEFCVIVTIKDTRRRDNIYNEVTKLLDVYSFVHGTIKINEEVRVRYNQ